MTREAKARKRRLNVARNAYRSAASLTFDITSTETMSDGHRRRIDRDMHWRRDLVPSPTIEQDSVGPSSVIRLVGAPGLEPGTLSLEG